MDYDWTADVMYEYFLKWEDWIDELNSNNNYTDEFSAFQTSGSYWSMAVDISEAEDNSDETEKIKLIEVTRILWQYIGFTLLFCVIIG